MKFYHSNIIRGGLGVAVLALTLFFGYFRLTESPAVWYDEGLYSIIARTVSHHGIFGVQTAPGVFESAGKMSSGFPLIAPVALSFTLLGTSVLAARVVMPIFIAAAVVLTFFLLRKRMNFWVSIGAALLVATMPVMYGNGKSVIGEVPGFVLLLATLMLVDRLPQQYGRRRWIWFVGIGIVAGLCFAAKPIYMPLIGILFIAVMLLRRSRSISFFEIGAGGVGFLAMTGVWVLTQFTASDTVASMYGYFTNPYESSQISALIVSNLRGLISSAASLYTTAMFALWSISVIVRFRGDRNRISAAELVAFGYACFVMVNFLKMPGWHRYFFPAQMLAIIYGVPAILSIFDHGVLQRHARAIAAACVMALAGAHVAQLTTFSYVAQYYGSNRTATLTQYFGAVSATSTVFLYNTPEIAVFLPSDNFYLYARPHPSWAVGDCYLDVMRRGDVDMVVVTPALYTQHPEDFTKFTIRDTLPHYLVLRKP